jgi:cell division cycle 20-like protein 1 (cofactor of APC complex)
LRVGWPALRWSPHQHGLLASGGGTADRCIRFWNTLLDAPALGAVDTGSQARTHARAAASARRGASMPRRRRWGQVCNLMWSRSVNEIVSTHGYSLNQVGVLHARSLARAARVCLSIDVYVCVTLFARGVRQVVVWRYPTMAKLATLTGHTFRCARCCNAREGGS